MIKRIFIALTLITSLFLVGCGAASYSISGGPDKVTIKLENLPQGSYTLEVVAENCYGIQSAPLTINS